VKCRRLAGLLLIIAFVLFQTAVAEAADSRLSEEQAQAAVVVDIKPAHPLMDERLAILVSGLPPQRPITITAKTRARDGLWWRSSAVFIADARGRIDLASQASVVGSYHGPDAMGLFWSMTPDIEPRNADHAFFAQDSSKPMETEFQISDGRRILATRNIARVYAKPDIRVAAASDGVHGMLYSPGDNAAHPAVLVIGGSDGGLGRTDVAMLFASHGFTALALAYFGEPGLPATLEGVPMEYFKRAIDWLSRQPSVNPNFVAIYGESRGTEPALWVAASDPRAKAVVARSPSFALWGGVTARHLPGAAAWTQNGIPLPYIANKISLGFAARYLWDICTGTPVRQTALFLENLKDYGDTKPVEIAVENIHGPILLLAGKDDQIWPSFLMANRIMARRGHAYSDALVAYDEVGHPIPYTYAPLRGDFSHEKFAVGGTVHGTVKAQADAWPRILEFLEDAASKSTTARFN
jgi:pimeloyl-ACP methyl ester carboxylesterase